MQAALSQIVDYKYCKAAWKALNLCLEMPKAADYTLNTTGAKWRPIIFLFYFYLYLSS